MSASDTQNIPRSGPRKGVPLRSGEKNNLEDL